MLNSSFDQLFEMLLQALHNGNITEQEYNEQWAILINEEREYDNNVA